MRCVEVGGAIRSSDPDQRHWHSKKGEVGCPLEKEFRFADPRLLFELGKGTP